MACQRLRNWALRTAVLPPIAVGLAMLVFTLLVGAMAVKRHIRFGSFAYDLGIYDQAIWLISQGLPPYCTVRGLHILGDHFTPVLWPIALFYRFGMGASGLVWLQAAVLSLGAIPLYRMGKRLSQSPAVGLLAAVAYLLYPGLRGMSLFDFHPIALATPGLLFALDYGMERRALPFTLACAWCLICKQEASLVVACLGLWYAHQWRQPRALAMSLLGLCWFVMATRLSAYFAGTTESSYIELFSEYGNSTGEVLKTFLLTPWVPLATLNHAETLSYFLILFAPLALLPLRSPGLLWMMAFPLALNIFSNRDHMRSIHYQYSALLAPFLFAAAVATLSRIRPGWSRWSAMAAWGVTACAAAMIVQPLQQDVVRQPVLGGDTAATTRDLLGDIPAEASVSASHSLVPHITHRREIHVFPNPFYAMGTGGGRQALRLLNGDEPTIDRDEFHRKLANSKIEYILLGYRLNLLRSPFPMNEWQHRTMVVEALRDPHYGLVREEADVWVLKRGADHAAGLRILGLNPDDSVKRFERRVMKAFLSVVSPPRRRLPRGQQIKLS